MSQREGQYWRERVGISAGVDRQLDGTHHDVLFTPTYKHVHTVSMVTHIVALTVVYFLLMITRHGGASYEPTKLQSRCLR
jgi:hypothetical protein